MNYNNIRLSCSVAVRSGVLARVGVALTSVAVRWGVLARVGVALTSVAVRWGVPAGVGVTSVTVQIPVQLIAQVAVEVTVRFARMLRVALHVTVCEAFGVATTKRVPPVDIITVGVGCPVGIGTIDREQFLLLVPLSDLANSNITDNHPQNAYEDYNAYADGPNDGIRDLHRVSHGPARVWSWVTRGPARVWLWVSRGPARVWLWVSPSNERFNESCTSSVTRVHLCLVMARRFVIYFLANLK